MWLCSFFQSLLSGSRAAMRRAFSTGVTAAAAAFTWVPGCSDFGHFGHGANVFGRGAATATEEAYAEFGGFAGEEREVFGRGFGIDDAVAHADREAGVGHGAEREIRGRREFAQNGKKKLRANGAIGAYGLNIERLQFFPSFGRTRAAERGALFGVGELRDDGKTRKGTDRGDGGDQLVEIAERFENEKIDAAFFERGSLFAKDQLHLFGGRMLDLLANAEWADGAGEKHFVARGFAGFAGDFDTAMD